MADLAGVTLGVDVSHHQAANVAQAEVAFVIARTAQAAGGKYGTTLDRQYLRHKADAAVRGKLFSSYFYLGSSLSPAANAALHASIEPDRAIPVMLDWEEGSGNVDFLRQSYNAFTALGYHVWGTYAPRWYWQSQGSPSLVGLPPLVSSRYPDMVPGMLADEYERTPDSYWAGYGGLPVVMVQFTSTAHVSGYSGNLDGDAFKGSTDALWALFQGEPAPNLTPQGVDVSLIQTIQVEASDSQAILSLRNLPGGDGCKLVIRPGGEFNWETLTTDAPVFLGHVYAYGSGGKDNGIGHDPFYLPNRVDRTYTDREIFLPGALTAQLEYSSTEPFQLEIYG